MKMRHSRAGEVATLLTLLSVGAMIIGGFFGAQVTQLANRNLSSSQSLAAGACGASCSKNGDCSRTHTNSDGTKLNMACDPTVGRCLPASGERNRCDNGTLANCSQPCTADRHCNKFDSSDLTIMLGCDHATKTCQEYRPNAFKQCPGRGGSTTSSGTRATSVPTQSQANPTVSSGGSGGGPIGTIAPLPSGTRFRVTGAAITGAIRVSGTPVQITPPANGICKFTSVFEIRDQNNRKLNIPGAFGWTSETPGNGARGSGSLQGSNPSLPYTYQDLATSLRNTYASVTLTSIPAGYEIVTSSSRPDSSSFFCIPQAGDNGATCRNATVGIGFPPMITNLQLACGGNVVYGFKVRKTEFATPSNPTTIPNDPRVPTRTSTPTPTTNPDPTRSLPEGNRFKSSSYQCGVGFKVVVDPVISRVTIRNRSGAGQFELGTADAAFGSTTGRNTPIGYRMWQPRECFTKGTESAECRAFGDNLKIDWNPATSGGNGVPSPALHVKLLSGGQIGSDPNLDVDGNVDLYYTNNVPSWMFDGSSKEVIFEYYVTNRVTKGREDYSQRETSGSCTGVVTTPVVTTPTPTTPTRTPTPTVSTPTPEEPDICSMRVHFLIDNSSSVRAFSGNVISRLNSKIKDYVVKHPDHDIQMNYQFFNKKVDAPTSYVPANNFDIRIIEENWTNIEQALRLGLDGTALNVIFTDGIPTVIDQEGSSPVQCVGNEGQPKIYGCQPCLASGRDGACASPFHAPFNSCPDVCKTMNYSDLRNRSKSGKADYAVAMGGSSDLGFLNSISTNSVIAIEDLPNKIESLFINGCKLSKFNPASGSAGGARGGSSARSATQFSTSFAIANESDNRTIQSMDIQTCRSGSSQCVKESKKITVAPGQVSRFASTMDIASLDTLSNSVLDVSCTLRYSNGQSDACPKRKVNRTEGVQMTVDVTDKIVRGSIKTYREAADTNGDGVVNGLDIAICNQRHGTKVAADRVSKCDIVSDNVVNTLDRSVQVNYAGERTTTN